MVPLTSLVVPILAAAVAVFVVSSIVHMVLKYHDSDVRGVPGEDVALETLRRLKIPPGDYVIPYAGSHAALKRPDVAEKIQRGPIVVMTVQPGGSIGMGKSLLQWFVYCVAVGIFAAYIAGRALGPGAPYLAVFRFAGATAFAGYGLALAQQSIWWRRSWWVTAKSMFDALVYGLVTAGMFGWLWP